MQTINMTLKSFYIIPDKALLDWWVNYKKFPPIPHGHATPIMSATQGHPLIEFYGKSVSHLLHMNLAFTPGSLMAHVLFPFDRLMV